MSLSQTHLDDSAQHAFETLYASKVVPAITALESRRLLTWVISIGGGLLSTTVGIQISSGLAAVSYLAPLGVFFVFAGFFGGVGGAVWMLLRTHRDLPALYAEAMAQSLGLQFSPHRGFGRLSLFAQAGLAPITGRRALKGVFLGQLDGAPFEIAQVQDTSGLGKARFTTFQGFLLVVAFLAFRERHEAYRTLFVSVIANDDGVHGAEILGIALGGSHCVCRAR